MSDTITNREELTDEWSTVVGELLASNAAEAGRAARFILEEMGGQPALIEQDMQWYQYPRQASKEATRLVIGLSSVPDDETFAVRAWRYGGPVLGSSDEEQLLRDKLVRATSPYTVENLVEFMLNEHSPAYNWLPDRESI
jgi:hypothetical protein